MCFKLFFLILFNNMETYGFNKNVYKVGATVAFLILIANKSIRLCGALLIIILIYFVNKSNYK